MSLNTDVMHRCLEVAEDARDLMQRPRSTGIVEGFRKYLQVLRVF